MWYITLIEINKVTISKLQLVFLLLYDTTNSITVSKLIKRCFCNYSKFDYC